MKLSSILATAALFSAPAFAQEMEGDPANGETEFARQCVSCHVVADESGEVLAGRNGRIGPNLHGVVGRAPGSVEDFRYSDALVAYGALGSSEDKTGKAPTGEQFETVVWGPENTAGYLLDPTAFLREALDDNRARSKMAYKVRDEQVAADLYAYLATFSPDVEFEDDMPGEETSESDDAVMEEMDSSDDEMEHSEGDMSEDEAETETAN